MKRTASIAALLVLLIVPQASAAGGFLKTVSEAQKKAKAKNQLIFVDLFANWCSWCHRFDKEVVPSEAFQNATRNMVLLRLDTEDGKEGTQFSQRYGVSSLPTFLIVTPDLALAAIVRGYAPPARFVEMMNVGLARHTEFETLLSREQTLAKDYQKRLEIAREFRNRLAWKDAEQRLSKLTTESGVPANMRDEAFYELALLHMQQGNHEKVLKSVAEFDKVQKEGYALERARILIANVYLAQQKYKNALDELQEFKSRFPKSPLIPSVDSMIPAIQRMVPAK